MEKQKIEPIEYIEYVEDIEEQKIIEEKKKRIFSLAKSIKQKKENRGMLWLRSVKSRFKVNMMVVFSPWNESNLVRFLTQIFSGRESVIKLFDFRIISTLLIRDLRIFIKTRQIRKALIVLTLPLLIYYLYSRPLVERDRSKSDLTKIFPHNFRFIKKNLLLFPHMLMCLPKCKRRYQRRLLNPKEHVWVFSRSDTNLNYKNDIISDNQGPISWGSHSENESKDIEWQIDSTFNSNQNEYGEPDDSLCEWIRTNESKNGIKQLEEKSVRTGEFDLSSRPEDYSNEEIEQEEINENEDFEQGDFEQGDFEQEKSVRIGNYRNEEIEQEEINENEDFEQGDFEQEKSVRIGNYRNEEIEQEEINENEEIEQEEINENEDFEQGDYRNEEIEQEKSVRTRKLLKRPLFKLINIPQIEEIEKYQEELEKQREEIEQEEIEQEEINENEEIEQEEINENEEIEQEESVRTRESHSFSESKFLEELISNLSIDESCISVSGTDKPIEFLKSRKDAFQYFRGSERNRIVDLWKIKTYLQNPSANYDISSDPGWNIRRDINQLNCIRFVNQNLPSISFSSCDENKEQLTLNSDFYRQLKRIVLKITDQFTLSITNPNLGYQKGVLVLDNEISLDMDYHMNQFYELNNNILLLLNQILNYRDKLKHHFFFVLFNIIDKENLIRYVDRIISKNDRTETSVRLIFNQYKIQVDEHLEKTFKRFYLLKNALMKYSLSKLSSLSKLPKVFKEYLEYSLGLDPVLDAFLLDTTLDDIESDTSFDDYAFSISFHDQDLDLRWKKICLYLKLKKKVNKYYLELTKVFNRISKKFSYNLKDKIRTNLIRKDVLNNVTQDAINRYSSSWRKYHKEWFNYFIVEIYQNMNASSILIEYFSLKKELKKGLKGLISKKNRLLDPIELWTNQCKPKIDNNLHDMIFDGLDFFKLIKSKPIPKESLIDEGTIVPLGLNEKPINQLIIDLFDNEKNYMELFDNTGLSTIFNDRDNWLNPLKLSNQNSLRAAFCKANTFEFLDYLHNPQLNYKKRLPSYMYMERIHIKNKNFIYGQLFNLVPIHNTLSIGEIRPVHSEKVTISLIKSQVNILLSKYLRDQALIHDLYKSSNLLTQLNSFLRGNIYISSIEEIYRTPLISQQIVNFDKSACHPFFNSSDSEKNSPNQYPKKDFSSNIGLIQTQSFKDDLLSEISLKDDLLSEISFKDDLLSEKDDLLSEISFKDDLLSEIDFRMKKFAEKEKNSSIESSKSIIEDKIIGDKNIFLNKEKRKILFFYKIPQIDLIISIWDSFQTYSAPFYFFTSTGWKYMHNIFLSTFSEIMLDSTDQFVLFLDKILHNWNHWNHNFNHKINHNFNILWALFHQYCTLLKWKFRAKFTPKLKSFLFYWNLSNWKDPINQRVFEGKDVSISFDTWKYIENVREYDKLIICIFIGFLFYVSFIVPVRLMYFYSNIEFIKDLASEPLILHVIKMRKSYKMLKFFYNFSWYGWWLTFVDFMDIESDPDDIGLLQMLEIWYTKNFKWYDVRKLSPFQYRRVRSLLERCLSEHGVNDFLLRESRLFSIEERISQFDSKLTPPNGFFSQYFEKREHPGLLYFRYLAEFIQLGRMNKIGIKDYKFDSFSLVQKSIFIAFHQEITSLPIQSSISDQVRFFPLYPARCFSNRILLIGPRQTGRSYLAKSLAADSYLPLIKISLPDFLKGRKLLLNYENDYTSSDKESYLEHEDLLYLLGWGGRPKELDEKDSYGKKPRNYELEPVGDRDKTMEYYERRVTQFVFALKIAKLMYPCVIWIPSIHEMYGHHFYIGGLLRELLGDPYFCFEDEQETTIKQNIVVIASTHIPKKVDPFLISPVYGKRRFDTLINTKMSPALHREKEFPLLLRYKGLYLKKDWNYYDEFGSNTRGFTTQDLADIVNDLHKESLQQGTSVIDNQMIVSSFYRKSWGPSTSKIKFTDIYEVLNYKIGKAIIQNNLTYTKNFLSTRREFQHIREYYLHQWYLEPSIAGTAVKEFTIFYNILSCLAGSVARDLFLSEYSNIENLTPIDYFTGNDFALASSLLQSLLEEFPWLKIYQSHCDNNHITITPQFKKDMIQKGLSHILDKTVLAKELGYSYKEGEELEFQTSIVCSPRTWRFSFVRSNRFEHIKDITEENPLLDYLLLFGWFQESPTYVDILYWRKFMASYKQQPVYDEGSDVEQRKISAIWEARFLYDRFKRLGMYKFDTEECAKEYKPLDTPIIYLARRFIWDPVSIRFENKQPATAILREEFFSIQELLRRIYLTYNSERLKPFMFFKKKKLAKYINRRKRLRKIVLGIKPISDSDDNPLNIKIKEHESFETFKRFQEVGIRYRRVHPYRAEKSYERLFSERTRDDKFRQILIDKERENIELLSNECFIYNTLFESYEYLSYFFISNRRLLKHVKNTLLEKKWLSPNDIKSLLAEVLNKNM
nr:hypothetical protein RF2 [Cephalotaxus sinensis]UPV71292.1 hypothetical protein RF2 [Cephalotaxus sinensis]